MRSRPARASSPAPTASEPESFEEYLRSVRYASGDPWLVHVRAEMYGHKYLRRPGVDWHAEARRVAEEYLRDHPEIAEATPQYVIRPVRSKRPAPVTDAGTEVRPAEVEVRDEVTEPATGVSDPETEAPAEVPGSTPAPPRVRRSFTGSLPVGR